MPYRLSVVVCALLAFCAITAPGSAQVLPAEDHVVELGVMFWKPTPRMTLSTDALVDLSINEVDFVREFDLADKWFPEFRAVAGRRHKLRVSHVNFTYDEQATIERTFTFQGRTFTVGAPATADLQWDLWRFGYEWDFVSRDRGFFGLIAELKFNRVDAAVDSPVLRSSATAEVTAPVPTIGVAGRGYLAPMVSIGGEFSGIKLNNDEFDVKFIDFDINGIVSFGRHIGAQAGYRSVTADYIIDEDFGDLKMQGPYIGGVVRF